MLLLYVVSSSIFCRATRESLNIEGGVKLEERLNSFDRQIYRNIKKYSEKNKNINYKQKNKYTNNEKCQRIFSNILKQCNELIYIYIYKNNK